MKNIANCTRRGFIKISAVACGYTLLGLNFTRQAIAATIDYVAKRQNSVYATDADDVIYPIKKSQENPMIAALYDEKNGFLKEGPCGHHSHELLHTHYHDRSADLDALKAKGIKLAL